MSASVIVVRHHDYTLKRTSATAHHLWPEGAAARRSQTSLVCRVCVLLHPAVASHPFYRRGS